MSRMVNEEEGDEVTGIFTYTIPSASGVFAHNSRFWLDIWVKPPFRLRCRDATIWTNRIEECSVVWPFVGLLLGLDTGRSFAELRPPAQLHI